VGPELSTPGTHTESSSKLITTGHGALLSEEKYRVVQ